MARFKVRVASLLFWIFIIASVSDLLKNLQQGSRKKSKLNLNYSLNYKSHDLEQKKDSIESNEVIYDIFRSIKKINHSKSYNITALKLDIYGPILSNYSNAKIYQNNPQNRVLTKIEFKKMLKYFYSKQLFLLDIFLLQEINIYNQLTFNNTANKSNNITNIHNFKLFDSVLFNGHSITLVNFGIFSKRFKNFYKVYFIKLT
jgi:hypothetical protein